MKSFLSLLLGPPPASPARLEASLAPAERLAWWTSATALASACSQYPREEQPVYSPFKRSIYIYINIQYITIYALQVKAGFQQSFTRPLPFLHHPVMFACRTCQLLRWTRCLNPASQASVLLQSTAENKTRLAVQPHTAFDNSLFSKEALPRIQVVAD